MSKASYCACGALALLPDIHHAALTCHECIWHDSNKCQDCVRERAIAAAGLAARRLHERNCEVASEGLAPAMIAEIEGYLWAEAQMWDES